MTHGFVDTRHGCLHYADAVVALLDALKIDDPALFVKEVDRLVNLVVKWP